MAESSLLPALASFVAGRVLPHLADVPRARDRELSKLAEFVRSKTSRREPVQLVYVCTHNSRRSHLGQVWAAVAAYHYGFSDVHAFSGGTEVTAFNPRAVDALRRAGFQIDRLEGDNPVYTVRYAGMAQALSCRSKRYDDETNPRNDFVAVMTCSAADQACPVVPGATLRVVTTYEDPKSADGSPDEKTVYDERARQIAIETFRVFQLASEP